MGCTTSGITATMLPYYHGREKNKTFQFIMSRAQRSQRGVNFFRLTLFDVQYRMALLTPTEKPL